MGKNKTFIKLMRCEDTTELLSHPKEFILLTQIAIRARRTDSKIKNLKKNQALIGDYATIGITEQSYRSAKANIQRWGYATFQPTNKGTIATITDSSIYDINTECSHEQANMQSTNKPTLDQRSTNEQANMQPTTNKKDKKDKKDKKEEELNNFKRYTEEEFILEVKSFKEYETYWEDFIFYWTELAPNNKMKFQLNPTWETKKRLSKWKNNNFGNYQQPKKDEDMSYMPSADEVP